jgi:hypothetical protein
MRTVLEDVIAAGAIQQIRGHYAALLSGAKE